MIVCLVAPVASLVILVGAQASDIADRSTNKGFLSKYTRFASDASKTSLDDYDKFLTNSFNHVKHRNAPDGLVEHGLAKGDSQRLDAIGNYGGISFPATDNGMPKRMSVIGASLVILAAMLGFRIRRGLQRISTPAGSLEHVSDLSIPMAPAGVDNILELKFQERSTECQEEVLQSFGSAPYKESFMSRGWLQHSTPNLHPVTICHARFRTDFSTSSMNMSPQPVTSRTQPGATEATRNEAVDPQPDAIDVVNLGVLDLPKNTEDYAFMYDSSNVTNGARKERKRNRKQFKDRNNQMQSQYYSEVEDQHVRLSIAEQAFGFQIPEASFLFHMVGSIEVPSYIASHRTPLHRVLSYIQYVLWVMQLKHYRELEFVNSPVAIAEQAFGYRVMQRFHPHLVGNIEIPSHIDGPQQMSLFTSMRPQQNAVETVGLLTAFFAAAAAIEGLETSNPFLASASGSVAAVILAARAAPSFAWSDEPLGIGDVAIREVPGKGEGLFAVSAIRRGTFVMDLMGEDIDANDRNLSHESHLAGYINHGRRPNLHMVRQNWPTRRLRLFASRDIQPDEELSYDYGDESRISRAGELIE